MQNGAHYNKILNNAFIGKQCGYDDLIYGLQGCTYNLIEGNTFQDAVHVAVEFQGRGGDVHHNIVRNNVIRNELHTGLNVYSNADYTLVEGNIIIDCGDVCGEDGCKENICGSKSDVARARHTHPGIQVGNFHTGQIVSQPVQGPFGWPAAERHVHF